MRWYADRARDLPWRRADATPWGVLVSEFMLQQTPVDRVLPVYESWLARWPAPAALAAEPPGEAVRAWGRLGYPRRALWLHATATTVVDRHGGRVPADVSELRALPGVGEYTAAAVAAFAYRRRTVVLDTNVRRVLGRLTRGEALPVTASPTTAERAAAETLLPAEPEAAATWSVAVMELGALVCTARSPRCDACPVASRCRWLAAGRPATDNAGSRAQAFAGTDRQVRGLLLAVLRAEPDAVPRARLEEVWPDRTQRERALDALVADGLVEPVGAEAFALPGTLARSSRTGCRTAPSDLADPLHRVGEIAHDDSDVP
ncbi:MAG: A/G-specific adenine glycosylase [Nocardioidaceae bacterium]|jgi:A/G-specific adenine glycosylase|nr:A/G-specific adenine glycosylase [Nocardioidaceae bacterium]